MTSSAEQGRDLKAKRLCGLDVMRSGAFGGHSVNACIWLHGRHGREAASKVPLHDLLLWAFVDSSNIGLDVVLFDHRTYGRAERDDCGHAANNFPQEVTGQLTSALVPFLTARDISRQIFGYEGWMRISNRKVPPTHGGKAHAHLEGSRRCLGRTALQPPPSCMRSHDLRRCKLLCKKGSFF